MALVSGKRGRAPRFGTCPRALQLARDADGSLAAFTGMAAYSRKSREGPVGEAGSSACHGACRWTSASARRAGPSNTACVSRRSLRSSSAPWGRRGRVLRNPGPGPAGDRASGTPETGVILIRRGAVIGSLPACIRRLNASAWNLFRRERRSGRLSAAGGWAGQKPWVDNKKGGPGQTGPPLKSNELRGAFTLERFGKRTLSMQPIGVSGPPDVPAENARPNPLAERKRGAVGRPFSMLGATLRLRGTARDSCCRSGPSPSRRAGWSRRR